MLSVIFFVLRMIFSVIFITAAPFVGGLIGGFWGVVIGLVVSLGVYLNLLDVKGEAHYPELPTCLKCGGSGRLTATDGRYAGYQCEHCKRFWKTKIRYH